MAQNQSIEGHEVPALDAGPSAINIEQRGDICVVHCQGRLVAGLSVDHIHKRLDEIRRSKCTRLLADFREVPSIGSPGIAFIANIYTCIVREKHGHFVIAGATHVVQRALEVTGLSMLIPVVEDLGSGMSALTSQPTSPLRR